MKHNSLTRKGTISLVSAWLILFGILPILLLLGTSFLSQDAVAMIRFSPSLASYVRLFEPAYLLILFRSLELAGVTTLLCLLVGYPFAWWTARMPKKWRTSILILLMIPFWTNSLVRTYAIRLVLGTRGIANSLLLATGLIHEPIQFMYTDLAVVLGLFYLMLPFMILPLYAGIEKLDWRLMEAARDLGASLRTAMVRVVFPLTMPGIMAGCTLVFVPTMGLFYVADLLGGARQLLVGNFIQQQFLSARDWPMGAAASVVLILLMAVMLSVYGVCMKRLVRRMGGVA